MREDPERRAAQNARDRVEWLAALWQLTEPGKPQGANPNLLTVLRFAARLGEHPAFAAVARLRREQSRDRLIKAVVTAAYGGQAPHPELSESLETLLAEAEDVIGIGPWQLVEQAREDVQRRAEALAGELDPAGDLEAVTGERVPVRVVLAPSVFLPLPQDGRHGVLVRRPQGWAVHLHFGFPLQRDPEKLGIDRAWILGGAWHYAIHLYLERYWSSIERRLAESPVLEEAVSAVSPWVADGARKRWTDFLRTHLNVAFKALLSRRIGMPVSVHRAFARASGLVLFPWFDEWLQHSGAEGAALAAHLSTLPEALAAARPVWEGQARSAASDPGAVNLALVSPSVRRACMVVPDEWSKEAAAAAAAGWRLLPLALVRYEEWLRTRAGKGDPVIALGEPERNPLVRRVLEQRGLSLEAVEAEDPAIIALSKPGFEDAPWCIAVAVARPETAAALRIEAALAQTCSHLLLDGGIVVEYRQVPLDQLDPVLSQGAAQ